MAKTLARVDIASFNIFKKLGQRDRLDDFHDLLGLAGLDVAGLQEIVWEITPDVLPPGWEVEQASDRAAGKDPIVYNPARAGHPLHVEHREIIPRIDEPGGRFTPARSVTVVVFPQFIHINVHLNADVEGRPGHPSRNEARVIGNHRGLLAIIELADEMQCRFDLPVFVTGDLNVDFGADRRVRHPLFPYANLTRAGFKCCWDRPFKEESTRSRKPKRGRTIDHVWARGTKTVRVKFTRAYTPNRWGPGDRVESDHLAAVVTALLKRRTFPHLFSKLGLRMRGA